MPRDRSRAVEGTMKFHHAVDSLKRSCKRQQMNDYRAAVHGLLEQLAAERRTRTARAVGVDCSSGRLLAARATLPTARAVDFIPQSSHGL